MDSAEFCEADLISPSTTTHVSSFDDTLIVEETADVDESLKTAPSVSPSRSSRQYSGSGIDSSPPETQPRPLGENAGAVLEAEPGRQPFQILCDQSDSYGQSSGDQQLVQVDSHFPLSATKEPTIRESENLLPPAHDSDRVLQVPKNYVRPRANSACAYLISASRDIGSYLLVPKTESKTTNPSASNDYPGGWKSLRITSFDPQPTVILANSGADPRMSVDGRMIEECDYDGHEQMIMQVAAQQSKLARERSREKIRRIVAIVSVALTLLAVLLVTAFLALGSKLEKQCEYLALHGVDHCGIRNGQISHLMADLCLCMSELRDILLPFLTRSDA